MNDEPPVQDEGGPLGGERLDGARIAGVRIEMVWPDRPPRLPVGPLLTIMSCLFMTGMVFGQWLVSVWFAAGFGAGALSMFHLYAWRWWRQRTKP